MGEPANKRLSGVFSVWNKKIGVRAPKRPVIGRCSTSVLVAAAALGEVAVAAGRSTSLRGDEYNSAFVAVGRGRK